MNKKEREKLILDNLGLAVRVANKIKYQDTCWTYDDVLQECKKQLIIAIDKYTEDKNNNKIKLSTFIYNSMFYNTIKEIYKTGYDDINWKTKKKYRAIPMSSVNERLNMSVGSYDEEDLDVMEETISTSEGINIPYKGTIEEIVENKDCVLQAMKYIQNETYLDEKCLFYVYCFVILGMSLDEILKVTGEKKTRQAVSGQIVSTLKKCRKYLEEKEKINYSKN